MAHFDEKSGLVLLSADDTEVLKEASMNTMNQKSPNTARIMKWILGSTIIPKSEWTPDMKQEAYKQNSD